MERIEMLKAFDETGGGVKALVDSGFQKVPEFFVRPSQDRLQEFPYNDTQIQVPVIDLSGIQEDPDRRKQIVEDVRIASQTWGFFQVVNHGIPISVLDGMIDGVREFHEQSIVAKKKYYSREVKDLVKYSCNYDLFTSKTANWRDTLSITFTDTLDPQDLPAFCRDSSMQYSKDIEGLGYRLHEILSEVLGLETDHLGNMECPKGHRLHCNYYPACPEPELVIGAAKHTDPGFLTMVLQDQSCTSLQVLHKGHWVDVQPIPGGLVVNIGDLLELVSNGKLKSSEHRVTANRAKARVSVACFISGPVHGAKVYRPIKDLVTEENPAIYKEVLLSDYIKRVVTTPLGNTRPIDYYKV